LIQDSAENKLKVLHVITGLGTGGAEMMLYKLLSRTDQGRFLPEVISLTDMDDLAGSISELGIPVHCLGMRRQSPNPWYLLKLIAMIRRQKPDVIQTWMYHADLIGGLAAKLGGNVPVIWGIHNSSLDLVGNRRSTIWVARLSARLSRRLPLKIVCCSEASLKAHSDMGYIRGKMLVINNGFDLASFKADSAARFSVRRELGLDEGACLVGLVARFDPQKDHQNFVEAAAILSSRMPNVHYLLCGDGITRDNEQLCSWIMDKGLDGNFHLLGRRRDVPRLTAALDVACSSSRREAFPLVVGEAMACGVPCVATDVGDSAFIVGGKGKVVPPSDPFALARGLQEILEMDNVSRDRLGREVRERVKGNFDLSMIVERYETLYRSSVHESVIP